MFEPTAADTICLVQALGVLDAAGVAASPGAILLSATPMPGSIPALRVLAVGRAADVLRHPAASLERTRRIQRPRAILIPGLVNAHTHLDLTHIGPRPHDPAAGFVPWVEMIRRERCREPEAIAASVWRGVDLSLAAGVVAVGDIAGAPGGLPNLAPWRALRSSPLRGVSFLEFFGVGRTQGRSAEAVESAVALARGEAPAGTGGVRLGLQPHAPNTVGLDLFRRAVALARTHQLPLSTHLAESKEEREFVARAAGPQRELLERLGVWDDSILNDVGHGRAPVSHLEPILRLAAAGDRAAAPFVVAHVNDADDREIRLLAETGTRVVYCPRASRYFGADRAFGPHRYRDMLREGIRVALGTDSIVNLPQECARGPGESQAGRGLSVLDEMRTLYSRDQTDPLTLLRMGTANGANALGLPETEFRFIDQGILAGLVAVEVADAGTSETVGIPEHDIGGALVGSGSGKPELLSNRILFSEAARNGA